jgi:hypothetical protein
MQATDQRDPPRVASAASSRKQHSISDAVGQHGQVSKSRAESDSELGDPKELAASTLMMARWSWRLMKSELLVPPWQVSRGMTSVRRESFWRTEPFAVHPNQPPSWRIKVQRLGYQSKWLFPSLWTPRPAVSRLAGFSWLAPTSFRLSRMHPSQNIQPALGNCIMSQRRGASQGP